MHNWRKLIEVDTMADFLMEVKTPIVEELAKAGGFDVQANLLRSKLEDETKDIQKYLKDKEEFNKQKLKVHLPHVPNPSFTNTLPFQTK
jgi:hypothetical protein